MLEVPELPSLFEFAFPSTEISVSEHAWNCPHRRNPVHRSCLEQIGMQELAVILPTLLSPAGLYFGA